MNNALENIPAKIKTFLSPHTIEALNHAFKAMWIYVKLKAITMAIIYVILQFSLYMALNHWTFDTSNLFLYLDTAFSIALVIILCAMLCYLYFKTPPLKPYLVTLSSIIITLFIFMVDTAINYFINIIHYETTDIHLVISNAYYAGQTLVLIWVIWALSWAWHKIRRARA